MTREARTGGIAFLFVLASALAAPEARAQAAAVEWMTPDALPRGELP